MADIGVPFFASVAMTSLEEPPSQDSGPDCWIQRISPVACWKKTRRLGDSSSLSSIAAEDMLLNLPDRAAIPVPLKAPLVLTNAPFVLKGGELALDPSSEFDWLPAETSDSFPCSFVFLLHLSPLCNVK